MSSYSLNKSWTCTIWKVAALNGKSFYYDKLLEICEHVRWFGEKGGERNSLGTINRLNLDFQQHMYAFSLINKTLRVKNEWTILPNGRKYYLSNNSMSVISKTSIHFSRYSTRHQFSQITTNIHQSLHYIIILVSGQIKQEIFLEYKNITEIQNSSVICTK